MRSFKKGDRVKLKGNWRAYPRVGTIVGEAWQDPDLWMIVLFDGNRPGDDDFLAPTEIEFAGNGVELMLGVLEP